MIKALIFDFDGVIIESTGIKTAAFRELFAEWPEHQEEMVRYHVENMGVSRFLKFRYFFENLLHEVLTKDAEARLNAKFSEGVLEKVANAPLVNGVEFFLQRNQSQYRYFIASATPEEELRLIIEKKGLTHYFSGIGGTPRTKVEIAKGILRHYQLLPEEVVFVGDARSDQNAAETVDILFIARLTLENLFFKTYKYTVVDFNEMDNVLAGVEVERMTS